MLFREQEIALETLISILSGLPPRSEVFSKDTIVVGRALEADLMLNHPEVSRRHCRILREGGTWFAEDLGSQRGTIVGGTRISGKTELKAGDHVRVGPVTLAFGTGAEEAPPFGEPGAPLGGLLLRGKPTETIPLESTLVFGRFAAERIFDTSLLLNQRLTGQFPQDYPLPYYNINAWYRSITGERLKAGTTYLQARPIWVGYLSLVLWTIAGFGACFILLGRKERETE